MAYQLIDEPTPGPMAKTVVDPLFPLLAVMVGGLWAGVAWFAWNGHAVGSPTQRRELRYCAAVMLFSVVARYLLWVGLVAEVFTISMVPYLLLLLAAVKITVAYLIWQLQHVPVALFHHFQEGEPARPWLMLVGLYFADEALLVQVDWLWRLVH